MAFGRQALIDFVEWSPQRNDIFAYRFPETNLSTLTQLVVRESQEAVLFSKGKVMGKFGPGKHTLSTENLPLLRNLYGIPFGGRNPFTAEVWFVNRTAPLDITWRTDSMKVMDPEYGQSIPIFAEGQYGLKVMDAERFLIQLVGTLESFTATDLRKHFMGSLVSKTKSTISSFVAANGIGINYISAHLDDLSQFIHQPLSEFWEGYGFALTGFYITTVDIDTSTELGKKIEKAVASRSAQGIAGYTWQQAQMASVAKTAATNGGSMGGMMAAAMLAGNNGAAAGMVGTIMQPNYGTMQTQMQQSMNGQTLAGQQTYSQPGYPQWGMNAGGPKVKEVFCARCGKKHPVDQRFCPSCGKEYIACPVCGADNPEKSQRCIKCGTHLTQDNYEDCAVCPRCGKPYKPGVNKFCPSCGNKLG